MRHIVYCLRAAVLEPNDRRILCDGSFCLLLDICVFHARFSLGLGQICTEGGFQFTTDIDKLVHGQDYYTIWKKDRSLV